MTGILNNSVATVMENKAINNNNLSLSLNWLDEFTDIFNKKPNKIPATVVNNELSLKIES
jgi:hypothetical protein